MTPHAPGRTGSRSGPWYSCRDNGRLPSIRAVWTGGVIRKVIITTVIVMITTFRLNLTIIRSPLVANVGITVAAGQVIAPLGHRFMSR